MVSVLLVVSTLFFIYISQFYIKLIKNYFVARKTGIPLIIVPVKPSHLVWLIISVPLRPVLKRYAPSSIYYRLTLAVYGWEYHERRIIFRKLNTDSFMLVTCGQNELYTINREIVSDILRRPLDFDKGKPMKQVADIFGPSLFTSVGDSWSRQRKLITGIINERISRVVFEETWRQTRDMVEDIEGEATDVAQDKSSPNSGSVYNATFPAMKRIASNVLSYSAYGMSQDFKPQNQRTASISSSENKFDMIECINIVIGAIILAALLPARVLSDYPSFLPGSGFMKRVSTAKDQYPSHVKRRLEDERALLKNAGSDHTRSNLTSMLIQASEQGIDDLNGHANDASGKKQLQQLSLSEDELRGNLFVFTTAGFETTANALTYALVSLMAEPKWQDWILEEVDELFDTTESPLSTSDSEPPDYATFYPRAFRCLALMMEVLRLYPPIVHLARSTPETSCVTVRTSQKAYTLPPDCLVYVPFTSLHTDPKIWRDLNLPSSAHSNQPTPTTDINETIEDVFAMTQDEYLFRPSRWVNQTLKKMPDGSMSHSIFQPPKASYAPFSGGPRICPGQKMAQVEFVCVILALFKDYRIEAVKKPGESDAELQSRLAGVLADSHAELTMVMERLHEVEVRFVKRRKS